MSLLFNGGDPLRSTTTNHFISAGFKRFNLSTIVFLGLISPKVDEFPPHILSLESTVQTDFVTPLISKGNHNYPPLNTLVWATPSETPGIIVTQHMGPHILSKLY